jgi:hypothetical protein
MARISYSRAWTTPDREKYVDIAQAIVGLFVLCAIDSSQGVQRVTFEQFLSELDRRVDFLPSDRKHDQKAEMRAKNIIQ